MQKNFFLYEYITTREFAIICWFAIFVIWIFFHKEIRNSLLNFLKLFKSKIIQKIICSTFIYLIIVTYCLYYLNLWDFSLLKDSIVWFIFSGMVLLFRYTGKEDNLPYFKTLVFDNLKFSVFFEYIFNLYTFSFIVEFIFIPVQIFLGIMSAFSETKEEYAPVKRFFDIILSAMGIFFLFYCLVMSIIHYKEIFSHATFNAVTLPLWYSLTFFPIIYFLKIYSEYESAFIRLRTDKIENKQVCNYFKRKLICIFNFNYKELQKFTQYTFYQEMIFNEKSDVDSYITLFYKRNTLDGFNSNTGGFNPVLAEKFMKDKGFSSDYYKYIGYDEGFGEYYAFMYKRFDGTNVDAITYSIEGNQEKVLKIKLEFDEFTPDSSKNKTHSFFVDCIKSLYQKAFGKEIPKNILSAIKNKEQRKFHIKDNYYIRTNFTKYPLNHNLITYDFTIYFEITKKIKKKRKSKHKH